MRWCNCRSFYGKSFEAAFRVRTMDRLTVSRELLVGLTFYRLGSWGRVLLFAWLTGELSRPRLRWFRTRHSNCVVMAVWTTVSWSLPEEWLDHGGDALNLIEEISQSGIFPTQLFYCYSCKYRETIEMK
jgi:hypothetical protein